jgi:uncharacterized protein
MIKIPKDVIPKQKEVVQYLIGKGIVKVGVFGSYARRENRKRSDADILVKLKNGTTLFELVRFERELKHIIRRKIDLVTYGSIHPLLKRSILKDEVRLIFTLRDDAVCGRP